MRARALTDSLASFLLSLSHQDFSQGLSQEEMMKNIWNYVDRIVTQIVKPQKLLYVAVDGVAPRAKMNQQRSRRFRAAKDAREMREEAQRKGVVVDEESVFDSNCITPGTEFMGMVRASVPCRQHACVGWARRAAWFGFAAWTPAVPFLQASVMSLNNALTFIFQQMRTHTRTRWTRTCSTSSGRR